jgi:Tol biopolymer transport system component
LGPNSLEPPGRTVFDFTASWSPDGSKVVFTSTRDGNSEIYVMNADGTGQTRLTNSAASDYAPSWGPLR